MKAFLIIFIAAAIIWPVVCWVGYSVSGWKKWEKLFRREVNRDDDLASSVGLKKFGNYNYCVRIGIEDYCIAFRPTKFLLFHKSFCIPWIQILSYRFTPGRLLGSCILHTSQGDIGVYGDIAEIVAHGCESHYVSKQLEE